MMPTIRCALSSVERWSIISTDSASSGRFTCRPRELTARTSKRSGNFTCATATARVFRSPASCKANPGTDRNSPCALTCIARPKSTPRRPTATAPARPWRPWRKCSPRPCRKKWASATSVCRSKKSRQPRASRQWSFSPSPSSLFSSSSPRNTKVGRSRSACCWGLPSRSSVPSSRFGLAGWRTMFTRRSGSSCLSASRPRMPSSSSNSAKPNTKGEKVCSTRPWLGPACGCAPSL